LHAAAAELSLTQPDYDAFYTQMAWAVRVYLSERTELPTLTSTPRDLQAHMLLAGTDQELATLILRFLRECDAVRWAHLYPSAEGAERSLALAFEIIGRVAAEKSVEPQPPPAGALSTAGAR
jgi:hypothetical protein